MYKRRRICHRNLEGIVEKNEERVTQLREGLEFPSLSLSELFFTNPVETNTYINTIALYKDILVLPFDIEKKTKEFGIEFPYLLYLIVQARGLTPLIHVNSFDTHITSRVNSIIVLS